MNEFLVQTAEIVDTDNIPPINDCNWTQLPNDFIDKGLLKTVGASAGCLYWCICRKTKGWQKDTDSISYSQLEKMTGFSRPTISKALKILRAHKLICVIKTRGDTTAYSLLLHRTSKESLLDQLNNFTSTSKESLLDQLNNFTSTSKESLHTIDSLKDTSRKIKNESVKTKKVKNRYGEYSHVLLTDEDYDKLKDKVDDREYWIKTLDESIEEKGNIYHIKNFYLAILKWYGRDKNKTKKYDPNEIKESEILAGRTDWTEQ